MRAEEEIKKELKTYEEGLLVQSELYTTSDMIHNACEQSVIRALKWVLNEGEQ